MIEHKISHLGLSQGEVKAYLTLLRYGPQKKYQLATRSGVSTSKIYEIISKLSQKGLVSTELKGKTNYCVAKDPKFLEEYIEKKERELKEEKKVVKELLPELYELEKVRNTSSQVSFQFFEGQKSTQNSILQAVREMRQGNTMYSFGARNPNINLARQFHRERIENNISLCSLYPKKFDFTKNKEIKLLEGYATEHSEGFAFYILDKKVILLAGKKNPRGLVIEHPKFREAFKSIFDDLKKTARKVRT